MFLIEFHGTHGGVSPKILFQAEETQCFSEKTYVYIFVKQDESKMRKWVIGELTVLLRQNKITIDRIEQHVDHLSARK